MGIATPTSYHAPCINSSLELPHLAATVPTTSPHRPLVHELGHAGHLFRKGRGRGWERSDIRGPPHKAAKRCIGHERKRSGIMGPRTTMVRFTQLGSVLTHPGPFYPTLVRSTRPCAILPSP